MPVRSASRSLRRRWWLLAGAFLACAACPAGQGQAPGRQAGRPRPTPAPSFVRSDSTSRAELLAYAHSLQFDTTRPAMAAEYLVVPSGHQLVAGPVVKLAPEIGSGSIRHEDLRTGRILARLTLSEPCPQAGLPAGNSYLWVDSTGGVLRETLIPEADSAPMIRTPVRATAACLQGSRQWIPAAAWFEQAPLIGDSTRMIRCYPCDCTMCCTPALVVDLNLLDRVRRPGVTLPQPRIR